MTLPIANLIIPTWALYTTSGLFGFPVMLILVSIAESAILIRPNYPHHSVPRILAMVTIANAASTMVGILILAMANPQPPRSGDAVLVQIITAPTIMAICAMCLASFIIEALVLFPTLPKAPKLDLIVYILFANIVSYSAFYLIVFWIELF